MIKVCINPQCEEIAHNCPKEETTCRNCEMRLVTVSDNTYYRKFRNYFFQYDYSQPGHVMMNMGTL